MAEMDFESPTEPISEPTPMPVNLAPSTDESPYADSLHGDLRHVFNKYSVESWANIPDNILASFTIDCLDALTKAVSRRDSFFGIGVLPQEVPLDTTVEE